MLSKPPECKTCQLYGDGRGYSIVSGTGDVPLLVIAEASGRNERRLGRPLVETAPAGGVFEKALNVGRMSRDVLSLTNVLRCQPPGNELKGMPYERAAIDHCKQYLDQAVAERSPKLILALGDIPLRELSLVPGSISELRGFVLPSRYGCPMLSTYHPSHLARGAFGQLFGVFLHDVRVAYKFALNGIPPKLPTNYILDPSNDDIRNYLDRLRSNPDLPVAYDIETPSILGAPEAEDWREKRIIQIQFSSGVGEAIVLPWTTGYVEAAKEVMATGNLKWGWNCLHRNTSVWMADGSWKAIWKIKRNDLVRTRLKDGTVGIRSVTASMRKKARGEWIRIGVDGGQCRGTARWKDHGVVCTPDHKWLTSDGWKLAEDLTIGMEVYLPRLGDSSLIQGTALGDGYISPLGRLTLSHSNKAWAKAKADHFGVNLYKRSTPKNGYKKDSICYEMGVQVAREWRAKIYKGDKTKRWTPLSTAALAVFYQDDGWVVKKGYARICLHSFDPHDVQAAKRWAEAHFGKCSLYRYKNGYALGFLAASSKNFFSEIAPFVHPSNYYKLPAQFRGYYNGWLEKRVPQIGRVVQLDREHPIRAKRGSFSEYCIEVQETHNFFTRAGVVANSRLSDRPCLKANGVVINGEDHDLMNAFAHLQPNFVSGKDAAEGEDKGVPARLMSLQSCLSFYYPEEGPYKGMVQREVAKAKADYEQSYCESEGAFGCVDEYTFIYDRVLPVLQLYGARDADYSFRLGVKLFASLKRLGLW